MAEKPEKESSKTRALVKEAKSHVAILGGFVGLLWLIQVINSLTGGGLIGLGIQPRSFDHLTGILFAPFIHVSFAHLIANTVPLAVLGWFVMLRKKRDLLSVSLISGLVGGLGTWLTAAAGSVTVGASILIFGYLGYLLARGIFERRLWPILGSIVTFVAYGSALHGIVPGAAGISWQGHLFGLIGGILAARLLQNRTTDPPKVSPTKQRVEQIGSGRARIATDKPSAPNVVEEDDDVEAELARLRRMR